MGHTVSCPLLPQYAGQGKHHHPPPQVSHEPAPSAPSDDPGRASPWLCHPKQGRAQQDARGVSHKAKGAKADENATIIFGLRTCFGGGKSTCFALVYDNVDAAKKMEPKYRQIQSGFQEANSLKVGRKQRKEKKNREKKFRGTRKEKRVRPGKDEMPTFL